MSWTVFKNALARLFHRGQAEADLDEEIRAHIEHEAALNREKGMSAADAELAAVRKFGNATLVREDIRRTWGTAWLDALLQDLKFAVRTYVKAPRSTAAILATLGVAIGGVTAIFAVAYPIILRPLPYHDADKIYWLRVRLEKRGIEQNWVHDLWRWQSHAKSFEHVAGVSMESLDWGDGEGEYMLVAPVSASFFPLLGVHPVLGRVFTSEEDRFDKQLSLNGVIVVSYRYWKDQLGGRADAIGRKLHFRNRTFEVIGVMPDGFQYPEHEELAGWTALQPRIALGFSGFRGGRPMPDVIARLRKDATPERAHAELTHTLHLAKKEEPLRYADSSVKMVRLQDEMTAKVAPLLLALCAAVGIILFIACVNVAVLLLARAVTRRREMSLRLALGATTTRLLRQLISESLALAVAGGLCGAVLAYWIVRLMLVAAPGPLPLQHEIQTSPAVLLFAGAVVVGASLLFGVAPAVRCVRQARTDSFHAGVHVEASRGQRRWLNVLLTGQVALTFALLLTAGLLARTLHHLMSGDPGFRTQGVLSLWVRPDPAKYRDTASLVRCYEEIVARVKQIGNVVEAGTISHFTVADRGWWLADVVPEGSDSPPIQVENRAITAPYFSSMRIPVLRGRSFKANEEEPVAVLSRNLAIHLGGMAQAVGRRIRTAGPNSVTLRIVGVVEDVKDAGLDADPKPIMYRPLEQNRWGSVNLMIQTKGDTSAVGRDVKAAIAGLDPTIRIRRIRTMEDVLSTSLKPRRFAVLVAGSFAVVSLLLAVVGLYGILTYSVRSRTRELGIRKALGATPADLRSLVFSESIWIGTAGTMLGCAIALALKNRIGALIYGVPADDPLTFVATAALIVGICIAASLSPARYAVTADPLEALRAE